MLYSGHNQIQLTDKQVGGGFITIDGERFYQIENYDLMSPFFISLASDSDLWMYIASTGGLTAGRRSPEQALFPYYTDDKITEQYEQTGPKTILRVSVPDKQGVSLLLEPFSERQAGVYNITRTIAKNTTGNKLLFTETNHDLDLQFSYMWAPADRHGWVRKSSLKNLTDKAIEVEMLDGLQNLLPAGVERKTQNEFSTLVDGYKKTEQIGNLTLLRMEAILVDRAEPSECLRCNTAYCLGLDNADYLVSSKQLDLFRRGAAVQEEHESKGVRGAAIVHATFTLDAGETKTWYFVVDTDKDAVSVRELMHFINQENIAIDTIEKTIQESTQTLKRIVEQNDGIQHTADEHNDARHFANTLFNTMRGGYYLDNYNINAQAFVKHIAVFNKALQVKHAAFLQSLPATINHAELLQLVEKQNDPQLLRLTYEYLPITFGRRHGDPSRPWNMFDIKVKDQQGRPIVSYQGNWRDIFQNWEALSLSYPGYINSIISKFLNATTADGYNPYKVTSEGIDWEVIEPENPWSNIGYWGDHQIIYLLKLLELSYKHDPDALRAMLNEKIFAFANVPYRLKTYKEIVADPKNSIVFDDKLHKRIFEMIPEYGQDARLLLDKNGQVLLTTMADKLLITLLAKLTNFIPEAGIWMNTLRPEWNDANNALVGYGASMVTLCYMRRYVSFLQELMLLEDVQVSTETRRLMADVSESMEMYLKDKEKLAGDVNRRKFINNVGVSGEEYRKAVYVGKSGRMSTVGDLESHSFFCFALKIIDESIRANKRQDGLYEAYNLVDFKDDKVEIKHLYQMLEGQVAVLTSGILSAEEAADLLDAMRQSDLYRPDQRSYMLYPNRRRKTFLELNNIVVKDSYPSHLVPKHSHASEIVSMDSHASETSFEGKDSLTTKRKDFLIANSILTQDADGGLHFNASFNNAEFLKKALEAMPERLSAEEEQQLLDLYEQVFNHQAFTGRSGTFYKYEGLGCIYWHMVSKLLLAVGETIQQALTPDTPKPLLERLKAHYYAIKEGIGAHKTPQEYGSFPFDAYSHTPSMTGVQQPGMTGQVKEDIINRFFELGIDAYEGRIFIVPLMLGEKDLVDNQLNFTYCGTKFVYIFDPKLKSVQIEVDYADGSRQLLETNIISADISKQIFMRSGNIKQIKILL